MAQAKKPPPKKTAREIKRRLPADKRRDAMLAGAAAHFAECGFDSTTRDIANALGVTQALIYKHFASKEDLIERTLERIFNRGAAEASWLNANEPVEAELEKFYLNFVSGASDLRMRLFIRAGLDGRSLPARRGNMLNKGLFLPAIAALRTEANLPDFSVVPAMRGERELLMTLHASMVFLGIRRFIYSTPMPKKLDDVVRLSVKNFMLGAVTTLQNLHENGEESLRAPFTAGSD